MTGISFSFDPDWMYTLSAPFMTNAFLAGLCISLAAGVMGYFTIARHSTFAAHALAHIGLPGATGAVLFLVHALCIESAARARLRRGGIVSAAWRAKSTPVSTPMPSS